MSSGKKVNSKAPFESVNCLLEVVGEGKRKHGIIGRNAMGLFEIIIIGSCLDLVLHQRGRSGLKKPSNKRQAHHFTNFRFRLRFGDF